MNPFRIRCAALWLVSLGSCAPQPLTTSVAPAEARSVTLSIEGEPQRVSLEERGPDLALIIRNLADGGMHDVVVTPSLAAGLLGDRRLAVLWPTLERWGGNGLNRQRDRAIADLPIGDLEQHIAGLFDDARGLNVVLEQVYTLRALGRFDDAHRLLDAYERSSFADESPTLAVARSDLLKTANRKAEAMTVLTRFLQLVRSEDAKIQALSVLSELQVEEGLAADKLATLTRRDELLNARGDSASTAVGDWVRACALSQMADGADRKAAIADTMRLAWRRAIREDSLPLAGDGRSNLVPDYLRFATCTADGEGVADVLAFDAEMGRVPLAAAWLFQPAYRPLDPDHAEAIAEARRDPRMAHALELVRPLGPEYVEAVNGWRLP